LDNSDFDAKLQKTLKEFGKWARSGKWFDGSLDDCGGSGEREEFCTDLSLEHMRQITIEELTGQAALALRDEFVCKVMPMGTDTLYLMFSREEMFKVVISRL